MDFFLFSSAFSGEASSLELGDEVEFTLGKKTNKVSAETIKKLPKGTVAPEVGFENVNYVFSMCLIMCLQSFKFRSSCVES